MAFRPRHLKPEWQAAEGKGDRTRIEFLDAALGILAEEGLEPLTLARVARELGVSKSLVGYHYASVAEMLQDLFGMLGKRGQAATSRAMESRSTLEEKLAGVVEAAFRWQLESPAFGRFFLLMYHQATIDRAVAEIHGQIVATGVQRLEYFLYESGRFSGASEVRPLAEALHSLLTGALIKMISLRQEAGHAQTLRAVVAGFERISGVRLPPIRLKD